MCNVLTQPEHLSNTIETTQNTLAFLQQPTNNHKALDTTQNTLITKTH